MKISELKAGKQGKRRNLVEMGEKGAKSGKRELNDTDVQGPRPAGWYSTLILLIFLIFVIFAQRYTRQLAATQAGRQASCNG